MGEFASVSLSSAAAFISTELDEFVLLLILFARNSGRGRRLYVAVGKFLALILVMGVSVLFSSYLLKLPEKYIGLLGIVPFVIGVKEIFDHDDADEPDFEKKGNRGEILKKVGAMGSTFMVSLGSSGDNFAIYIPFFTSLRGYDFLICAAVFLVMQAAMIFLAVATLNIPVISKVVKKVGHGLIPVLLILLGLYILIKNGTMLWIFGGNLI